MAATTTTNQYLLTAATTDAHHLQMTANALYHNNQDHHHHHINDDDHHHHHLELTAANNIDVEHNHYHHDHHHQHLHNHRLDERSSSVTSDQYSSLNLSSVGSSAHHSPIIEHEANSNEQYKKSHHHLDEGAFSRLTITTALDTKANKGPGAAGQDTDTNGVGSLTSTSSALSDYHGSIPCSPVESSIGSPLKSAADDLLMLASPSVQPHATLVLSDHVSLRFEERDTRPRPSSTITESTTNIININSNNNNINNTTTTNNNNNNHLHPDAHQHHQKVRSYSHSTTFSPLVQSSSPKSKASTPTRDSKLVLLNSENHEPNRGSPQELLQLVHHQQQQPIIERPRRLSRIENRQSLHDLGYGCIESYFKLQRLGKGTYATVYMGRSKLSNDLVALKEILKEHDEGAPCTAIREVSLLRLLRHNNIVTLHDICHTPKKLTLVFEYVGPDLYAYMKENNHLLSIHNVRLLLYQLLRGIAFCHSRQVLHRDLKPQNLLINSRGELKICDFGLARAKSIPTKSYSNEVVTLWYRPPDVLLGNTDYDHSIDMWGVGCIFYEMASGRTFFPGSSVRQQLYLIFSSLGAPSQSNWPEILTNPDYLSYSFPSFRPEKLAHRVPRLDSDGVQLLQSFLRFKPSERISADEARRDPFFACLPERVHHLNERESIFDVPGVYMTLNPGQKLSHLHHHHHHHHHH